MRPRHRGAKVTGTANRKTEGGPVPDAKPRLDITAYTRAALMRRVQVRMHTGGMRWFADDLDYPQVDSNEPQGVVLLMEETDMEETDGVGGKP